jgi:hypothetical protein
MHNFISVYIFRLSSWFSVTIIDKKTFGDVTLEPLGHVILAVSIWIFLRNKIGVKGLLLLLVSSTFSDYFLPLKSFYGIAFLHDFMHSVIGFALTSVLFMFIGYLVMNVNGVYIGLIGVSSHAMCDFIEDNFPQSVFNILGHNFTVAFTASLVALMLSLIFFLINEVKGD